MSSAVLTIESLFLARYAEVHPDGTLTVIGGGIGTLMRDPGTPVQLMLAGTLMADGPEGEHAFELIVRLVSPEGEGAFEAAVNLTVEIGPRRRVPFAMPLPVPPHDTPGQWHLSVAGHDDVRVLSLDVYDQPAD